MSMEPETQFLKALEKKRDLLMSLNVFHCAFLRLQQRFNHQDVAFVIEEQLFSFQKAVEKAHIRVVEWVESMTKIVIDRSAVEA
ncbi:MAG: hypothetical protein Q9197_001120 [Variospora fuerteventurae]